jgi:uncharacterized membrane protein
VRTLIGGAAVDVSDVVGPIDFVLLEFDPAKTDGSAAAELGELVDRGIVRLYDFLVVAKADDGTVDAVEVAADEFGGFGAFAGARSGLVDDDDIAEAGAALEPGRAAALIVYENTWAVPFISAARAADAEVVASARIPSDVIEATLDALDAADTTS